MEISSEYLADLLIGIARAQNAIIDAVDRANPGFRNNHMLSMLNVAANVRTAEPRLIDLPSRVLLRLQGRAALENAAVRADLERLLAAGSAAAPAASPAPAPAAARPAPTAPAVQRPAPAASASAPATAPRPAAAPAPQPAAAAPRPAAPAPGVSPAPATPGGGEELDFSKK